MNYGDLKTVKQVEKRVWEIGYRGGDGKNNTVEVIAHSFEAVNNWIMRHTWCNTVFHVAIKQTINEIGE